MASKGKKLSLYSLSRENVTSDPDEFNAYKRVIFGEGQSHRSVALMAAAFVEHALLELIKTKLIILNEEEGNALFFDKGATLGTFADRIDIACAMGLISKDQQFHLNIIRRIRNVFAHAIKDIHFDHQLILQECRKFNLLRIGSIDTRIESDDAPKEHYTNVCHLLAIDFKQRTDIARKIGPNRRATSDDDSAQSP